MSAGYLLDTNVVSELRKGSRCDRKVRAWHEALEPDSQWISVLVIGEIRQGVEKLRSKDPVSSAHLERWLEGLAKGYRSRILPITVEIADRWGVLNSGNPVAYVDGFLCATALEHKLTLATRNVKDVSRTGASYVNPFE
jgi:predicted nucleic acid-binding protein